jgi:hypothetical protein
MTADAAAPRLLGPRLLGIVLLLGVTQNIGYGTLYYAYAILVPAIAAEFAVSPAWLFGVFSAGLLASGLAAPWIGAAMDRYGAPRLMAGGSLLAGLLVAGLALAPGPWSFAALTIALELVSVAVLYDAAFATLALVGGAAARRSITHLTLLAGIASTMFWPLTGWLVEFLGWRGTYAVYAAMHLLVALPLHLWLARRTRAAAGAAAPAQASRASGEVVLRGRAATLAFWAVAISFALSGVIMTALSVHLVAVLQAMALGTGAYLVAMLMGPAQVLIRLTDALFWRGLHPLGVGLISALVLPLAVLMLLLPLPAMVAGAVFAVLFGFGQGLSSIVRGTIPLALFGADRFASRLGRMAAVRTLLGAGAPFLFAAGLEMIGARGLLWVTIGFGLVAMLPLLAVAMVYWRARRVA